MVAQSELHYTWRVPADSRWLRFYLWLYRAERDKITFCRWFWGSVFALPVLLLIGGIYPFAWLVERGIDHHNAKKELVAAEPEPLPRPPSPPRVKRDPVIRKAVANGIVTAIGFTGDKISAGAQRTAYVSRKVWKPVDRVIVQPTRETYEDKLWFTRLCDWSFYTLIGIGITICVGTVLSAIAYGFYVWQEKSVQGIEDWAEGVGVLLGLVGVCMVVAWLMEALDSDPLFNFLDSYVVVPLCWFGRGLRHVGHFFYMGYYVTKTRTCPRIEVVE